MSTAPTSQSWVERAALMHPDRVAIDAPDGVFDYLDLERSSRSLAADLAVRGLVAGDEVGISLPSSASFAVALHACLRAGLVAVPDDLRLPDARRAERLSACSAVIGEADIASHRPPPRRPLTEAANAGTWLDYAPAHADAERVARWSGPPIAGSASDSSTPAVRITTSGTTGPGTPVHLTRGSLLWNALGSAAALGQPADERWLSAMPVSHVGGLTVLVRSAIAATTAVLRPRFDLDEQLALLREGAATITSMVPTTLSRLLDAGLERPPNLRLVLLGGAPIPPELLARAETAGVPVASTYGLSEACSQVLTRGRPLFCTRVALRSELSSDDPAGAGEADEVLVSGPTLATGVCGAGGWLATGDRGRRNAGGDYAITGRIAETIVTGGENVAPTEIEAHLVAQPGIADAGVLGVEHPEWGEQVEARIVLAPRATLDEPGLIAALRGVLPPYAVPKRITAVDALPRTPTGKLIRRELR